MSIGGPDPESWSLRMGLSKIEINLRRLLAAAPQQQNHAKLVHYVTALREQLEQLAEERTPEGVPRISKAAVNDYSQKIEAIAAKLAAPVLDTQASQEQVSETIVIGRPSKTEEEGFPSSPTLRRRNVVPPSTFKDKANDTIEANQTAAIKLDSAAQAHIVKHRRLQEDITDEMVGLAKQLKESSQMMSQSLKNTEKILDSTEKAIEHSLAGTGHATARAVDVYSKSSKTSCLQWLLIFAMTCIFIMVVLLIRVT